MAIAPIQTWLNSKNKNYLQGHILYQQYGSDAVLLRLLKSGTSSFHAQKLFEALSELNNMHALEPKPVIIQDPEPPSYSGAPDPIIEVRDQKNRRYAQARRLYDAIRVMDSQSDRCQAALQLLDHMDFVGEAWNVLDEYRDHGTVKELPKPKEEEAIESMPLKDLMAELKNLPTYISRDKKKYKAASTAKEKEEIAVRLQARQIRLESIKKRVNELV